MMMRGILVGMVCGVLFAPCALTQKVTTEFDQSVDFSKYKTFALREGQLKSPNPALNSELTKKRIETDIETALTTRGLAKSGGAADLNVFYTFGSMREVDTAAYPGGPRGYGTRVTREVNTKGTLVIDLRDSATRALVWRGVATQESGDPEKLAAKVDDMVKKAIAKYPPKK